MIYKTSDRQRAISIETRLMRIEREQQGQEIQLQQIHEGLDKLLQGQAALEKQQQINHECAKAILASLENRTIIRILEQLKAAILASRILEAEPKPAKKDRAKSGKSLDKP